MERYEGAIESIDRAIRQLDDLGIGNSAFAVDYHLVKICSLKGAERWGDELYSSLQVALQRAQDSGTPLALAQTLEEIAEVYVRNGDWCASRLAYERALKECGRISGQAWLSETEERCRHNLEYIQAMEIGPIHKRIRFWKPLRY